MPRFGWPQPHEWIEGNRSICICLTRWKKINFILKFILINFIPSFIQACCFETLWAHLTAATGNDWIKLLHLLIPYHMQKTNFIIQIKWIRQFQKSKNMKSEAFLEYSHLQGVLTLKNLSIKWIDSMGESLVRYWECSSSCCHICRIVMKTDRRK